MKGFPEAILICDPICPISETYMAPERDEYIWMLLMNQVCE